MFLNNSNIMSRHSVITIASGLAVAVTTTLISLNTQAADAPTKFEIVSNTQITINRDNLQQEIVFQIKNRGISTWYREGYKPNPINLGTVNNQASLLYEINTWHSKNRISLSEAEVRPDGTGTFRFKVNISDQSTAIKQDFRLVQEQIGWFGPVFTVSYDPTGINQEKMATPVPELNPSAPTPSESAPTPSEIIAPKDYELTPTFVGPLPPPVKKVEIDLKANRLRTFENDTQIKEYIISPGKWSTPTPVGNFKIHNKSRDAYSRSYKLWMPNWNAFTANGAYGIHGLPYWKTSKGRVYEGANHLGLGVSHGCVRLGITDSNEFFEWADNGTPINIHR